MGLGPRSPTPMPDPTRGLPEDPPPITGGLPEDPAPPPEHGGIDKDPTCVVELKGGGGDAAVGAGPDGRPPGLADDGLATVEARGPRPGFDLWDRWKAEPSRAWAAFQLWRDMGPGRTSGGMTKCGFSHKWVAAQKREWKWEDRAAAFDAWNDRQLAIANAQERVEMAKRQAMLGLGMQAMAEAGMAHLDPATFTTRDVTALADVGVKIERLARGVGTENTAIAGELRVTVVDAS